MSDPDTPPLAVPASRSGRMMRAGGMAAGILAGALMQSARALAQGQRPTVAGAVLTPATAQRLARDLGAMRGAAMKLGQMLSMDAGTVLPPEMTAILSQLRAQAPAMPPRQLRDVLDRAWGAGWYGRFASFDVRPFAAASIGQVHRARTQDGRDLAIKVQYPGVRDSIDSDLDNAIALMRMPGLIPNGMEIAPVIAALRAQLHQEADYRAEAASMAAYGDALGHAQGFVLPRVDADLSGPDVLAMSVVPGRPLETLDSAPQETRDRVAAALITLTLSELFTMGLMQSDPNPGNYRYDPATGAVGLLDFGAVVRIDPQVADAYRALLRAVLHDDPTAVTQAMMQVGYLTPAMTRAERDTILTLFQQACAPLTAQAPHDFGTDPLPRRMADQGVALARGQGVTHVPPPHTVFLHRKIAGIYLIAQNMRARVALRPLLERFAGV